MREDTDLVAICGEAFSRHFFIMSNEATASAIRLYVAMARASLDGIYRTAAEDPRLPDDDATLARICTVGTRKFRAHVRPEIEHLFIIENGYWRIRHWELIRFSRVVKRGPISDATKAIARNRHGGCCAYCGDAEGPFEHDHLVPASRGGSEGPENIVLACGPCNRSKSDMTLMEWVSAKARGVSA